MVKALELARQMLFGSALALLVASTFLIPHHQVLGDDRGQIGDDTAMIRDCFFCVQGGCV